MQPIKTTGLVVRATRVGDYNKMMTVISPELGRISVWAKGVRSIKNPLMPLCSPLCYGQMILLPSGEAYTLTGGEVIDSFYHLRDKVEKLACGIYFADLAANFCAEGIGAEGILKLTLNALHYLEKDKKELLELKCMFELRMMHEAGLMPCLDSCVLCGSQERTGFSPISGGAVCSRCGEGIKISQGALDRAKKYFGESLKSAFETRAGEHLEEILVMAEEYIKFQVGKNIKTLDYLKSVM